MKMRVTRQHIIDEAMSWVGTPYHHQASCKGAGCDCLGLVRGIYSHFWQAPHEPPIYSPDWAEEGGEETMAQAARQYCLTVPIGAEQPGDILLFRYRDNCPAKHAGILLDDNRFIHAQHGASVCIASLGTWWRRHVAFVFSFPFPFPSPFHKGPKDQG